MKKLFTKSEESRLLDEEINDVLECMSASTRYDEQYDELVVRLDKLTDIRNRQKRKLISKENAPLIANLVGIAMILYHEKANVITTKAIGFVIKGRV